MAPYLLVLFTAFLQMGGQIGGTNGGTKLVKKQND